MVSRILLLVGLMMGCSAALMVPAAFDHAQAAPNDSPTEITPPSSPSIELDEPDEGDEGEESAEPEDDAPDEAAGPPPEVIYDVSKLPPPVRRIREQILEAAASGDVAKMGPIFEANGTPPVLSFGDPESTDPVGTLKSLSGDPEGREILAILIEVLDAGFVHVDEGKPEEMYIWPYFARYPIDKLTGPQMVELFKLLTAGDYEDMKVYGTYQFYRVGISPDGVWHYFVAGD